MEVVILTDMMNSYATTWVRIANTQGIAEIKMGDEFREFGTGEAGERFKIEGIDLSPIPGSSRLYLLRGHRVTQPQSHRAGAVLQPLTMAAPVQATGLLDDDPEPVAAGKRGRTRP